ncbi:hypothetical protein HHX47_DHR3000104 [Lentinula edodes]|nr:hypothetical protein HHX47_DHR3000104 [Lentinula edodes]
MSFARTTLKASRAFTSASLRTRSRTLVTLKDHKYTAQAVAQGAGRNGEVTSNGLDLKLALPKEMGGTGQGQNPEQLFAMGYSACLLGAIQAVAKNLGKADMAKNAKVHASVHIGEPEGMPGFGIAVDMKVEGIDEELLKAGHEIPYCLGEVPSNIMLKVVRPSRWLSGAAVAWGTIVTLMCLCDSFKSLLITRLFVGLTESALSPGILFYLSTWYPRRYLAWRVGLYVSATVIAGEYSLPIGGVRNPHEHVGAFSGLLAYGIERMDNLGGLHGWQWIFGLEGIEINTAVAIAIINGAGNLGGALASFVYISPKNYYIGYIVNIGCLVATILLTGFMMWEFKRENHLKEQECAGKDITVELKAEWKNMGDRSPLFRYPLIRNHEWLVFVLMRQLKDQAQSFFLSARQAFRIEQETSEQILDVDAVALALHIFSYFFLGLSTILGISGALYRSCPLVAMFCSMIMAQLVFGIGSGIYCLTILFSDPGDITSRILHQKCLHLDHFSGAFCERTPLMKYLTLALFIQAWLIEILGIYYAQAYVQELLDEETDGMKEFDYEFDYDYAYY